MMKAAIIAALAIPVFSAGGYQADLQQAQTQADAWGEHFQQIRVELAELGINLDNLPSSPIEEPDTEDTVIVSEKGLFFDAAASRLVYLGNVRLKDNRLQLKALNQLHVHLQQPEKEDQDKEATPPGPALPPAATEEEPAPAATTTTVATTSPAPVSEQAPAAQPAAAEKETAPVIIQTHSVIADTINNAILLYSPAEGEEILLQQENNMVRITPGANSAARILADPVGNILMEGSMVSVRMENAEEGSTTLVTQGGYIYYHAASHTLYTPGCTEVTHPEGTLSCQESLCIVLTPSEEAAPSGKGFMRQFTSLRFEGISTATAKGKVVATAKAVGDRPASRAEGDTFTYNGRTGACSLTGSKCRLVYGSNEICSNEALLLHPNGDIELKGTDIHGTYERESSQPGRMLAGTFKAYDNIIFRADIGTVSTQKGINLADEESDFNCNGPVLMVLTPKEDAAPAEQKPGMPNLALTRYSGISRIKASGHVLAHRNSLETGKCIGELQAESVESDLNSGETLLTSAPGEAIIAFYNGSRIVSTPEHDKTAMLELKANGDLLLTGDQIDATMQSTEGTTKAHCRDFVKLIRAEDRLETGSSTRIETPTAILTTTGSLHTILASTKPATDQKKGRFPSLQFNYDTIREATTHRGCTLRTVSGSMQCTGPVHITMDNTGKTDGQMMGGLKTAMASGNVAVAGKDSTGRLLRASGDLLEVNAQTGTKVLSGRRVSLSDGKNTHTASGKGASIVIDAKNNAQINGEKHNTHATKIRQQINEQKNKQSK